MLLSATLPISAAISGKEMGNNPSFPAAVSANGQYEVFVSNATDLVNGITIQGGDHVYLRNLSSGTTTLVDVDSSGTQAGDGSANAASLTPDGRYVAFASNSDDLTSNDTSVTANQIYVREMQTGQTYLVSLGTDGKPENAGPSQSPRPSIAEDGNGHLLIAYQSSATNLTKGDSNTHEQIFLATLNLDAGGVIQYGSLQTTLVSADKNGNGAGTGVGQGGDSLNPILSQNGSTLVFGSYATNLNVPGGYIDNSPNVDNLYLYTLASQTLSLLSLEPTATTAATGNQQSRLPTDSTGFFADYQESASANGQYAVFTSNSDNMIPNLPTYDGSNVFLRNLSTGTTSLVSINDTGTSGVAGGSFADDPVLTPDGRYVAFIGDSPDQTSNSNGSEQLYVRDMQQGQTYLVTLGTDGKPSLGQLAAPTIAENSNGQLVIAYRSSATDLTSNTTSSSTNQIFISTLNLDANGNIQYNTLSTKLVSADGSGNGGNDNSDDPILSKDGSTLAFQSKATNLAGETPDNADGNDHVQVFTYNLASGKLTQVSPAAPAGDIADSAWLSSISDNGQYLAYVYTFQPIKNGSATIQALAWNANTQTNTVIYSVPESGGPLFPGGGPTVAFMSGDGSTVLFIVGDAFGRNAIYTATNWQSGSPTFTPIASSPQSLPAVDVPQIPSMSADGKVIAYQLNDAFTKTQQLYVYANGTTTLASPASDGSGGSNGISLDPEVSADGSTVFFDSTASNLIAGVINFNTDPNNPDNIFAYNVAGNTVTLVSAKAPGVYTTDNDIRSVTLSSNGRYLAYVTGANDLVGNLPPDAGTVFAEDLQQGIPTVIASNSFDHIFSSVISGDGSTVAFTDDAQLTSTKTSGEQIYSTTNWLSSPTTTLVSVGIDNNPNNGGANLGVENPSISDNGQVIAFDGESTNLTNNDADANAFTQIFVRNLKTNTTSLASSNSAGTDGGNSNSDTPVVSSDGNTIVYTSSATDLVSGVSVPTGSFGDTVAPEIYAYLSNTAAPAIISNPSDQTVTAGQTATFTASASGAPVPLVQWQVSTDGGETFTNISGATSTTLTLSNTQPSQNGSEYQAVFSNIYGAVTSHAATLTVDYAPVVNINPFSLTVMAGQSAAFIAVANANPTATVQWQVSSDGGKSFSNLSGATAATLTLNNVTASMNGNEYEAVFTNSVGSVTTHAATLTVNSPTSPPPAPAPAPPPPAPPSPPAPKTPPLLALFDNLLGGTLTVNADGTETITDSLLGIPLFVSSFDTSGNLVSVSLFGINITFLFG